MAVAEEIKPASPAVIGQHGASTGASFNPGRAEGKVIDSKSLPGKFAYNDIDGSGAGLQGKRRLTWLWHMFMIFLVEFCGESSRGLTLPSLYLYAVSLGGDISSMAIMTSLFSLGRLISSTLLGWMSDKVDFKYVYILSAGIAVLGSVLHLIADKHVTGSIYLLHTSRFVVGFAAGNRSVCRANVASLTRTDQRLRWLTWLSLVVFMGFAVTPGIGRVISHVSFGIAGVHMNQFTFPGVILIFLNALLMVLLAVFWDSTISVTDAPGEAPAAEVAPAGSVSAPRRRPSTLSPRLVNIGVVLLMSMNFLNRGILAVFETVSVKMFLKATGEPEHSATAIQNASGFQLNLGMIGVATYLLLDPLSSRGVSEAKMIVFGFLAEAAGNLLLAPFPSSISFLRLTMGDILFWSIGSPICSAVVVAAFSKILGSKPQGALMGYLGTTASVARIVMPLLPNAVGSYWLVFLLNGILCLLGVVGILIFDHTVKNSAREEYGEELHLLNP